MNNQVDDLASKHVVILINYMRKHHVLVFKEFARRVGKLTILVSTDMENDRFWKPDWDDLNVLVQKNSTFTLKRNSGFDEKNFIHVPWDTISQLRKLQPDVVLSYEMGARSVLSSLYGRISRNIPVVLVGNMSTHIEKRRGFFRNSLRKILKSSVDLATYNGPSCKQYLMKLGVEQHRLAYFPYFYDPAKTFSGVKKFGDSGVENILFCGAMSERKGILPFTAALRQVTDSQLDRKWNFTVAGDGPLRAAVKEMESPNLKINFLGNCSPEQLRSCYELADVCAFPSLGDEWGMVPMEAWASGVPVLGSRYAQSVEANCQHGINGWIFDAKDSTSIEAAISEAFSATQTQLLAMSKQCRLSINGYSAENSANYLCQVVERAFAIKGVQRTKSTDDSTIQMKNNRKNAETNPSPDKLKATLSLDLDNKWSYLKSHNDSSWESHPGYLPLVVPRILAALEDLSIKITFFVVGQDAVIEENQDALKQITDHGHEIANHTFHHEPCLHLYTPEQLDQELQMAEDVIHRVTGQRTIGFRGPGFSLSDQTLNTLVRRGYKYDCTMFPTFLSPLARTYHFMTGSFTRKQVQEKKALFGKFSDGFMPNTPYLWQTEFGDLLEIPVTTFPALKTPIHATYLHYLATFSPWLASSYLQLALGSCRLGSVAPSLLLHPLDFLGKDDAPELKFFPGMKVDSKIKLPRIQDYLKAYLDKFDVVTMQQFASATLGRNLNRHSIDLARTGVT